MRWCALCLLLLAVLLALPSGASAYWHPIGGPLSTNANFGSASTVAVGGAAHVAYSEAGQLRVKRWDGSAWVGLGGVLNADPAATATGPSIADVAGVAWVAWFERNGAGPDEIHVARWDTGTSAWVAVGGTLLPAGATVVDGLGPRIASVGGVPYVVWSQRAGGVGTAEVTVKRWSGAAWDAVGGAVNADPTRDAYSPSIASIGGVAHVAFQQVADAGGTVEIRVASFGGVAWTPLGGALGAAGSAGAVPDIDALSGAPAVAWSDGGAVRVARWNGSAWVNLDGRVDSGNSARSPSLEEIGGVPFVAWVDTTDSGYSNVSRYDGSSWIQTGPLREGSPAISISNPTLTSVGGMPYAAWQEFRDPGVTHTYAGRYVSPPKIRLASANTSAAESLNFATVTVQRDDEPEQYVEVHYAVTSGTATAGDDFTPVSGTLVFDTGDITKTFAVPLVNDEKAEGNETATITLSDVDGGGDATLGTPSTGTLTIVDDDAVDTHFLTGPEGATRDTSPSFTFTDDPAAGATYECSLNRAQFEACPSPKSLGPLTDGFYSLRVRAVTTGGARDSTPAQRDFIVDTVAPSSSVVVVPREGFGAQVSPGRFTGFVAFQRSLDDPEPSSGIGGAPCVIDPPSPPATAADIPSSGCPLTIDTPGSHVYWTAAVDSAGNAEVPHGYAFTILSTPDTTITNGPTGKTVSIPIFRFTSSDPAATFECRFGQAAWTPCQSPQAYPGLPLDVYLFQVRAVSPDGVRDPSPPNRLFTLASETTTHSCRIYPPFGKSISIYPDLPSCRVILSTCPVNSECTLTGTVDVHDDDYGYSQAGRMYYNEPGWSRDPILAGKFGYGEGCDSRGAELNSIYTSTHPGETWAGGCPAKIGPIVYTGPEPRIEARCGVGSGTPYKYNFEAGDDDRRYIDCSATFTVRPAPAVNLLVSDLSVGLFANGPGEVRVTTSALGIGARAAAKKKKPKGSPLFAPLKKRITKAGAVKLPVKLSKAAKQTLDRRRVLRLPITIEFTPTGGKKVTIKKTVTFSSPRKCKPPKRDRKRKGTVKLKC